MSRTISTSNSSSTARPGLVGLNSDRGRLHSPTGSSHRDPGLPAMDHCPHEPDNLAQVTPGTQPSPLSAIPAGWDRFWIEDYRVLFQSSSILPTAQMSEIQRLNTLTRLILLIAIFLALFRLGNWILFLVLGLGLVIILYYAQRPTPSSDGQSASRPAAVPGSQEHYRCQRPTPAPQRLARSGSGSSQRRIRLRSK